MNQWRTHPAASMFPLMADPELGELAEDIRANGLLEPVWLWTDESGQVWLLDGRNRLRACERAGVEVTTRFHEGGDPIGFVVSENLKRRHLTTGQKAAVAAAAEELYAAEAATRVGGRPRKDAPKPVADRPQVSERERKSRERAARKAGTSGRSVARYKRVADAAPDLADRVRAGAMALDRAERVIRDRGAEQRRIAQARAEAASAPAARVDLRHGDFRQVLADVTEVDAVITDPPYPREFLPLLADLAVWVDKALKPDGVLAVLIGQSHLPEVYRLLDGFRPYRWTACYLTSGAGYVAHDRRVQTNWKPLLVYGGGPRFADVIRTEGTDANAKSHHRWGQDYAAFHTLVQRLTQRGDTVADPFMGSGTTLLAAHALGRHVVGCDVDPVAVATATERVT